MSSSSASASINLQKVQQELVSIWEFEASKEWQNTYMEETKFSYENSEYFSTAHIRWFNMDREMSSNVAGETGAVWIYKGALAATKLRRNCEQVKAFAREHMKAEETHLFCMEQVVPEHMHTRLLPLWKFCGFMLGFLPTILGKGPALYHTVDAVESFVEVHYNEQIEWLKELTQEEPEIFLRVKDRSNGHDRGNISELIRLLTSCCEDEVEHKLDARRRLLGLHEDAHNICQDKVEFLDPKYGIVAKIWRSIVDTGSSLAAELARRI